MLLTFEFDLMLNIDKIRSLLREAKAKALHGLSSSEKPDANWSNHASCSRTLIGFAIRELNNLGDFESYKERDAIEDGLAALSERIAALSAGQRTRFRESQEQEA